MNVPPDLNALTNALDHFAWRSVGEVPGLMQIWEDERGRQEIIVPLDPSRADFQALFDRAKRQIENALGDAGREYMDALRLQREAHLEYTTWHKETNLGGGLISWPLGEQLYGSVRASLVAAAKAARSPRKYHGSSSAYFAKRFLEETLMGQTLVGSFVVTAHVPASTQLPTTKTADEKIKNHEKGADTISTSSVMDKLESALSAAQAGIAEFAQRPNLEVFDETIDAGVSHELARALADLTHGGDAAVQLERRGDLLLPDRRVEFDFKAPDAKVFERLASRLIQEVAPRKITLTGEVTLLSREHGGDGAVRMIRLDVVNQKGVRKARVRLTPDQYELALDAHLQNAHLEMKGRLEREGNNYWLYDAADLRVRPAPSDDRLF